LIYQKPIIYRETSVCIPAPTCSHVIITVLRSIDRSNHNLRRSYPNYACLSHALLVDTKGNKPPTDPSNNVNPSLCTAFYFCIVWTNQSKPSSSPSPFVAQLPRTDHSRPFSPPARPSLSEISAGESAPSTSCNMTPTYVIPNQFPPYSVRPIRLGKSFVHSPACSRTPIRAHSSTRPRSTWSTVPTSTWAISMYPPSRSRR